MAWISSATFIAVCVTYETKATFDVFMEQLVGYQPGTPCFIYAAVIMLFNIVTFIKTALALCYNGYNDSQILHKNRKQNLIVCIKLATLDVFLGCLLSLVSYFLT